MYELLISHAVLQSDILRVSLSLRDFVVKPFAFAPDAQAHPGGFDSSSIVNAR